MNVIFLFCYKMKKAIVLGGSRGIGKAIADSLKTIDCDVIATSRKELVLGVNGNPEKPTADPVPRTATATAPNT